MAADRHQTARDDPLDRETVRAPISKSRPSRTGGAAVHTRPEPPRCIAPGWACGRCVFSGICSVRRMDLWRTELRDDGVFVAAYDNPPMNYFTGQATAELGELLARWRDPTSRPSSSPGHRPGSTSPTTASRSSSRDRRTPSSCVAASRRTSPPGTPSCRTSPTSTRPSSPGSRATLAAAASSSRSTATSASCSAATSASASPSAPSGS